MKECTYSNRDYIECPLCGQIITDMSEYGLDLEIESADIFCSECDRLLHLVANEKKIDYDGFFRTLIVNIDVILSDKGDGPRVLVPFFGR